MKAQENVLPLEGSGRGHARRDRRIGALLVEAGKLDGGDVERVAKLQRMEGLMFGEAALRLGLITADDLRWAIARQYDAPQPPTGEGGTGSELVVARQPFHPRSEELRALRTQLLIRWSIAGVARRELAVVSHLRKESAMPQRCQKKVSSSPSLLGRRNYRN